jgi:hypothetical protein
VTSAAKRAGSKFETDVLAYLRERGLDAERLAKAGSLDEGDIVLRDGDGATFCAELKARRDKNSSLSLGAWLGEAELEAGHYAAARGLPDTPLPILVVKRPGKPIAQAFVVMSLEDFVSG